jgi:putative flippase GtrA
MGLSLSFVAYGAVSVGALALELAVLHAALAAGLVQPVAVSCGYVCSAVFQFCLLRYVVFRVAHKTASIQALAFIIGQVLLWALLVGAVAALTKFFPLTTMQARLICVPTLFPVNYLVSKYLIFRR